MTSKSATVKSKVSRLSGLDWKPLPYMLRAVKWLISHGGAALLLDPGLRKTSITLKAITVMIGTGVVRKVLVVAPLRVVYSVWPREIEKWKQFSHLKFAICHGKNKDVVIREDADIYLVNPEGLEWFLENWNCVKPDTLVIDESTKFKNSQSKRFKLLKPFLSKFRRRWILTGTPAPNGLLDLFAQMYIVDEGRSLGRYITHYRSKYFDATGYGGYEWRLREGCDKLIYKAVKPYALRLEAKDYIELPELIENDIVIDLDHKTMQLYLQMEIMAFAELDDGGFLNAANAASAMGKCRQISNGAAYTEPPKWEAVHTAKLEALESILEERGGRQVMVAYEFKHDYEHACQYFKTKFPVIGGGVSAKAADKLVDEWNAGELPVLWVHPQSAAHGLNMQDNEDSDCIVWFTPTFNLEDYDQLNRRLLRSGAKAKSITVHRLVADKTFDLVALRRIEKKDNTQRGFLDAMKTYRRSK